MNSKKILFPAFLLLSLVQLYVPAKMILDREAVLTTGTAYKFKTAPVDPTDPFRGKYITLRYAENTIEVEDGQEWTGGETVYVLLTTDPAGFAKIQSVSKEKPAGGNDFIKAEVSYVSGIANQQLVVDFPFDRYYMEESKAYDAELSYWESLQDSTRVTYALVNVRDGEAVLKDVLIDGVSIREVVKAAGRK